MTIHTVQSTDERYTSPLAGNGEIVTRFGPTGYHNGTVTAPAQGERSISWAGRRTNTPNHALIRYGRLQRLLKINQHETTDNVWSQSLDYDRAMIVSTLHHGAIQETTRSLVCLTENFLIFHTQLINSGGKTAVIELTLNYTFPNTLDDPTPTRETITLEVRPHPNGFAVHYDINHQLGEVRLQSYPQPTCRTTPNGGHFTHQVTLTTDQTHDIWTWVMLSDRRNFSHFPNFDRLQTLVEDHRRGWAQFWATSHVDFPDPRLNDLRQSALYAIRCNASPWSIPPMYAPMFWEGRAFHDELYPFLGLLSGGYVELARRVPTFRLNTLPVAIRRGGGGAARFPWEATETGEEGSPYGRWNDERFHIGQFSESAWRFYLYQADIDDLRDYYPLLRGCAEMFVQDVLIRDKHGLLKTRLVTDFDEVIYPIANGIFTISAAIRTLENATTAAQKLGIDRRRSAKWCSMAQELRQSLPGLAIYTVGDDAAADHWHIAQVGPIFPFAIDVNSPKARQTLTQMHDALRTGHNVKAGSAPGYDNTHWMWAAAMMTTAYFMQGRGDEGYALLAQCLNSTGPFLSPNEQWNESHPLPFIPWFTTSAGAVLFAMHSIFVQVDEDGTTLLNGIGEHFTDGRFHRLLAGNGVRVSGEIQAGRLIKLVAHSSRALAWSFYMPARIATACGLAGRSSKNGLLFVPVALTAGDTTVVG